MKNENNGHSSPFYTLWYKAKESDRKWKKASLSMKDREALSKAGEKLKRQEGWFSIKTSEGDNEPKNEEASKVAQVKQLLRSKKINADEASPNLVAKIAKEAGIQLSSAEVVEVSDTYETKFDESLSLKVKSLCEEFGGTTLNSTGEIANPLNGVVEPYPAKRLKDKDFMKVFTGKDCNCGEGGCECEPVEESSDSAAGFDLTEMPLKDWQDLFQGLGLKPDSGKVVEKKGKGYQDKEYSSYHWSWKNQGNEIRTSYNPFTGKSADPQRANDNRKVGFSGYIGIEGNDSDVEHIYQFISDKGNWKDRKFGKASYI